MAHPGLELHNPVTGLRTIFHETAATTDGELLAVDWIGDPGWEAGPKHVHPLQEERFTVLEGRLRAYVDGVEREHGPGDVVVAPAGSVHTVANAGDGVVRARVEFRPALRSEDVLETLAALAHAGRTKPDGAPSDLLEAALILHEYEDEIYLAAPPLRLQRILFAPLARLARRRGRRAAIPYGGVAAAAAG